MRTVYHQQLEALTVSIADMCGLTGVAMERATQALLQTDLVLAEEVIDDHEVLLARITKTQEDVMTVLALQAPVAGDLRVVVSALKNVADLERMGSLALHVAQITRRR